MQTDGRAHQACAVQLSEAYENWDRDRHINVKNHPRRIGSGKMKIVYAFKPHITISEEAQEMEVGDPEVTPCDD